VVAPPLQCLVSFDDKVPQLVLADGAGLAP
jgi:hypothetical protein